VGFDTTRGDTITVENIRFSEPDESIDAALEEAGKHDAMNQYLPYSISAVFIILVLFIAVRPLVKFLTTPTEAEVDLTRLLPAGIEELETELNAERARTSALPDNTDTAIDIEQLEELLAENSKLVRDNPQQAALLIRYWINEGRL
jgi:flagellar biosynthesis/type III secretory pathway M-ring protein FliF/YscJ